MKILYVVNVDWAFISHRLPLAQEALKRNWKVYLITKNTGKFTELEQLGIKCIDLNFNRSGKNPIKELILIYKLEKIYLELQPDILHHVTLKPSIYGTIAARIAGISPKIINAVSGLGYMFSTNRKSIAKFITIRLLKYAFSDQSANFIFQNLDDKGLYNSMKFLNNNNNIIIKGSGVDENIFLEKRNNLSGNKLRIILLARMLKDKGVIEFIKAANALKDKFAYIAEFVLVGGIDQFNPSFISEKELITLTDGNYIKWIGHHINVREIYESADIVCLPSYREGLPKSLIEAMAVGCPIITTDAIGCRDCVEDGVNGFLVPVGDHIILAKQIERLILDKELRLKMGHKSRLKMVAEMSLSKVINMTFEFYKS